MNTSRSEWDVRADEIPFPVRMAIYLWGVVSVSLGIVLCKKCGLGISPISSIPFVLEDIIPLSFGTLTMLFHFVNTSLQLLMDRKVTMKVLLQFPVAVLFGFVINLTESILRLQPQTVAGRILFLLLSVFFTALGMVLMVNMQLVQNPPDGFVHMLSEKVNKEMGHVKIGYDTACVVISVLIGLIAFHKLRGFGIATIVSALTVGRLVSFLNPGFCKLIFGKKA